MAELGNDMKIGYIRVKSSFFENCLLVQRYVGKRLWFFDKWVTVRKFPASNEGEVNARVLAMELSHGYNFKVEYMSWW